MLKVGTSSSFEEGACFDTFYKTLKKHAIRVYINAHGWESNDCPLKVTTLSNRWHRDKSRGRVWFLFKMLGNIAHGFLKGTLPLSFAIIGETIFLCGLVLVCIVCFTEASIEVYTNFVRHNVLQKNMPSLTAVFGVSREHDY